MSRRPYIQHEEAELDLHQDLPFNRRRHKLVKTPESPAICTRQSPVSFPDKLLLNPLAKRTQNNNRSLLGVLLEELHMSLEL